VRSPGTTHLSVGATLSRAVRAAGRRSVNDMNDAAFDELIRASESIFLERHGIAPFADVTVKEICASARLSITEFCDAFARHVAHEYWLGNLSFRGADVAMGALYGYVMDTYHVRLPSYAWEVYSAFDDGEYSHRDDPDGTDPEEKYTKRAIESLVTRDKILG